jgi:hypothetical protein
MEKEQRIKKYNRGKLNVTVILNGSYDLERAIESIVSIVENYEMIGKNDNN